MKKSYFLSLFFEAESALVQTRSSCCCVRIRERDTLFVDAIILYLFFFFLLLLLLLLLSDDKEETVLFCFVSVCCLLFFFDFSLKEVSENTKGHKRMKKSRRPFLFSYW